MTRITVLAGGVGGAKFVRGLRDAIRRRSGDYSIDVVVNTGDDAWVSGLKLCPDLDSITYALAGISDTTRGWGREGETERVSAELLTFGVGWPWFTLGDLDLSMHIARTGILHDGQSLSTAVDFLTGRWNLGVQLHPMTDDDAETHVDVTIDGNRKLIHFQEWWVRYRAAVSTHGFIRQGAKDPHASPGALSAVQNADIVLVAPSNPVVSIDTILGIPDLRQALRDTAAPVVGVSPIIEGAAVRGMADKCLTAVGVDVSAVGVAQHYGSRTRSGLLDGWLIGLEDAASKPDIAALGMPVRAVPLWMRSAAEADALAVSALMFAEDRRGRADGGLEPIL